MGYLVICPTCGGKMSINARVCPHCGETDFIEPEMAPVAEPCRYSDVVNYDLGCQGKGFLCRTRIEGNFGIHRLQELQEMGVTDLSQCVCIEQGFYFMSKDKALREKIARAVAQHDLYWVRQRYSSEVYLHKVRCPQCKGTGKVMVERSTGYYIDIRKRA